jgi:hypothetical protein
VEFVVVFVDGSGGAVLIALGRHLLKVSFFYTEKERDGRRRIVKRFDCEDRLGWLTS